MRSKLVISFLGQSGHIEIHRVVGSADGSHGLCELQRDSTGRVSYHHLDDWTQKLWRQEGKAQLSESNLSEETVLHRDGFVLLFSTDSGNLNNHNLNVFFNLLFLTLKSALIFSRMHIFFSFLPLLLEWSEYYCVFNFGSNQLWYRTQYLRIY